MYFNRIKNTLKKYGQIEPYELNLTDYAKHAVKDGKQYIEEIGYKQYSQMLEQEYGYSWDGIRKELSTMLRFNVIK